MNKKCPKCGKPIFKIDYDEFADYGRGITVVHHSKGRKIKGIPLIHADCCFIKGKTKIS